MRHEIPFTAFESVKKVAGRKRTCLIKARYFSSKRPCRLFVWRFFNFRVGIRGGRADGSYENDTRIKIALAFSLHFQSGSSDLPTRGEKVWLNRDPNTHRSWTMAAALLEKLSELVLSISLLERCDLVMSKYSISPSEIKLYSEVAFKRRSLTHTEEFHELYW